MEQPYDGEVELGDIYSKTKIDGIVYLLFYLQTLSTNKMVFKQYMSNWAQRVFIARIFISKECPPTS